MFYAPDLIRSWINNRTAKLIDKGWSIDVHLPTGEDGLNKAGLSLERGGRSLSLTLWGTGMMEIICFEEQTDNLRSTDLELASEADAIERLEEFYLDALE